MLIFYILAMDTVMVRVKGYKLIAEVAETPQEREMGLMYRKYMPDSVGMLFVFEREGYYPFWMKNTYIPLSIAFISSDSVIVDIQKMYPMDLRSIWPLKPFQFALEVNQGWFEKRGIKPGDTVKIEPIE